MSETAATPVHLVLVERRNNFSSPTLLPAAIERLQTAFRRKPWYRDGWSARGFLAALHEVRKVHAPGGLALIGPRVVSELPPPFGEYFEPIQLGCWDSRLRLLSGEAPTRNEQQLRWVAWFFGIIGAGVLVWLAAWWFRTGNSRVATAVFGMVALVFVTIFVISALVSLAGSWYLVPGGVVIVKHFGKNAEERLIVCSPLEYVAILRLVSTGKSTYLQLELLNADGKRYRTNVSDREAISFLAAWQSPHPMPERGRLMELVV